ncbi:MAG: ERCC4 domain-containing protein, partial [archaeon]
INKRLLNQIKELKQYENKLLIIEGIDEQELYPENNGMHPDSVRGFLLSIALKHKIPMIFTQNYKDTARFIERIAKKKQTEMSIRAKKKSLSKKEQMQFILEGFPGIGPKAAKKLLEEFNSIKNIINTSEEELTKVIGKKAEIFRLIQESY